MDKKSRQPNRKRRAILQGSLAAPVVLTVSSASAQAVTSAGKRLANQQYSQPAKSAYFMASPDQWLRQSVRVVKLKYQGKQDKVAKEDWYYLDPSKDKYIKLSSMEWMSFGSLLPSDDWKESKEYSTRHLLVWVDPTTGAQSTVMKVEPSGGQIAATMSVMGSFLRTAA
jgi:hypothetical protein